MRGFFASRKKQTPEPPYFNANSLIAKQSFWLNKKSPLPLVQFRGALIKRAEIIPIEPDPGNAGVGKTRETK